MKSLKKKVETKFGIKKSSRIVINQMTGAYGHRNGMLIVQHLHKVLA
jgi:hypothetical protein